MELGDVVATAGTPADEVLRLAASLEDASEHPIARAIAAGARQMRPVQDQFYGDRSGTFLDPFGHRWNLATHVEDVSEEELQRRMEEFSARQKQAEPA